MVNLEPYVGTQSTSPCDFAALVALLERREVIVVGFSGKKGSGKDTFGLQFRDRVQNSLRITMDQMAFADSLKEEASALIRQVYAINALEGPARDVLVADTAVEFRMDPVVVHAVANQFRDEPPGSDGWSRTKNVWWLLRYLGTDIRQSQDRLYWVKVALSNICVRATRSGVSTVLTDVRFEHEAQFIRDIGGYLIRVDVTPETQRRRLMGRDGITPSEEALNHPSETQLDHYAHFNQRIDNNQDGDIGPLVEGAFRRWQDDMHVPLLGRV